MQACLVNTHTRCCPPGGQQPHHPRRSASGSDYATRRKPIHCNSRAFLDHLLIGPGGVFVVDSKLYSGKLHLAPGGSLWHGRHPLAPMLRAVRFEAAQAAQTLAIPGVEVIPLVAVHGASVPFGKLVADGVPVVGARRVPGLLRQLPAVLGPEWVARLADTARVGFHAAA